MTATTSTRGARGPYAKTEARKQEIIQAAFEVFARDGYRGGSMREIAELVGVSHSSLKHHFGGKDELLLEIVRRRDELEAPIRDRFVEYGGMLFAVLAMTEYNVNHPERVRLQTTLTGEAVGEDHPAREYEAERYKRFVREVAAGLSVLQAKGELRDGVDVVLAARGLAAATDGLQIQWLHDRSFDLVAAMGHHVDGLATAAVHRPTADDWAAMGIPG